MNGVKFIPPYSLRKFTLLTCSARRGIIKVEIKRKTILLENQSTDQEKSHLKSHDINSIWIPWQYIKELQFELPHYKLASDSKKVPPPKSYPFQKVTLFQKAPPPHSHFKNAIK